MPGHRKRRQFKQTDAFTRGMVIGLKRAGWSIRQIAVDTHLGASTVHRLWRRWLEQGNVAIYRNAGATRVTSARVDRRILRQAVAAPQATCTAILQHVQDTLDHSISTRTISRRLVANGLHSCRPLRRLPLTPPNRRQRLEWCRARSTWMTEWHRVVFSDESRFCLSSDSRRVRVWRRRGERSNPAAIVERPTVRQRGIMVWGAIAYDSRSPLLRIQGTMTAQRYVDDVLRAVTLPYLQGVPNALYQQDNARPHTARISQQALQDVQMLPWPPYSPNLSPIEHVWDIIGRRLHALPQPRSEDELWQMVEREWRAILKDAIRTLIDSLPRRVAACIAVRGMADKSYSFISHELTSAQRMPGHRKRRQFKQTDAFTRGMVIGLKRAGWSIRQIAADTYLGASTVHRLWIRWLEQGNVAINRNVGATRVTSARVDRRILRQAVAAPQTTCTAILQHVQDTLDHSISTRTISRRLVANGLHSCRPLRRLPLTPPNRRQRLEWCRARSTWMTEWHRVVFSDESRFCLSSDSRRVRVWRRRGERSNPAAIVERPTVRQRRIVVWGAIAYDSRSPLLRIQGTMTAQRYVDDVLRPVTLPYLQGVPNALYQQDNARPHTARISQQALQDVQMLPWPPYSPDLSPIEHVWDIIGRRLHALPQPRSEDELWQMVEREWRAIPQDAIRTLIDSLPRRVAACIAVREDEGIQHQLPRATTENSTSTSGPGLLRRGPPALVAPGYYGEVHQHQWLRAAAERYTSTSGPGLLRRSPPAPVASGYYGEVHQHQWPRAAAEKSTSTSGLGLLRRGPPALVASGYYGEVHQHQWPRATTERSTSTSGPGLLRRSPPAPVAPGCCGEVHQHQWPRAAAEKSTSTSGPGLLRK
ncbi:hypothetical protein LAZ67_5002874, partial [Cordylochernes scorpioides]